MGHYHKKPYKKHTHDPYDDIDIEQEYLAALNDDKDFFNDQYSSECKETGLLDEPDIVRQLRQEELEGTLPMYLLNLSEEVITTMTTSPRIDYKVAGSLNKRAPKSYQECYEIAKKTLKNLPYQ